jgi:hypothetical protein
MSNEHGRLRAGYLADLVVAWVVLVEAVLMLTLNIRDAKIMRENENDIV